MKPAISIGWASGALAAAAVVAAPGVPAADDTSAFIAAICSAENRPAAKAGPRKVVLIADMGTGRFPITTKVPEAQTWFDYGIKLYHGYYHEDAKAAFKRAEELDPACAMCAWGEAYARGPTLNYDVKPDETSAALALANKAQSLAEGATPKENALIAAMIGRYTKVGSTGTAELAFAKAMDAIAADNPADDAVADIAAHSWMIAGHRENNKEMHRAVDELEAVLKRSPNDTAAIHYYIHATELVGEAPKAEPYANKLAGLAPQASHLVHMAAHTFFRVGRYYDAAGVNARALGVDGAHEAAVNAPGDLGGMFYYGHNLGFGLAGAMTAGDQALSLKFADHVAVAYPKGKGDNAGNMINRAMIAYGRWTPDHALDLPDPGATAGKGSERTFWRYARGEAYAAKGDAAAVATESAAIVGATPMAKISRSVLLGRVAMMQNRPREAARAFETAAKLQEKLFADALDPPPWWYPVRRSVAAAKLKAGDLNGAAEDARDSLKAWPHDPLALTVLARAEVGLGKSADAQVHMDEARQKWRGDLAKMSLDRI